jgi:hypothetical protein
MKPLFRRKRSRMEENAGEDMLKMSFNCATCVMQLIRGAGADEEGKKGDEDVA